VLASITYTPVTPTVNTNREPTPRGRPMEEGGGTGEGGPSRQVCIGRIRSAPIATDSLRGIWTDKAGPLAGDRPLASTPSEQRARPFQAPQDQSGPGWRVDRPSAQASGSVPVPAVAESSPGARRQACRGHAVDQGRTGPPIS